MIRTGAGIAGAAAGAWLFAIIGFPAPALTGSAVGMTVAALIGARFDLPVWLRNLLLLALGLNIGSGVTEDTLRAAVDWPLTIALLCIVLLGGMWISRVALERMGHDPHTAILASAPGHLTFVISMAADTRAEMTTIAVAQSIRVLFLTLSVPLVVTVWHIPDLMPLDIQPRLGGRHLAALVATGALVSVFFARLRFPAPWLLGGMAVSAFGHGSGLTPGTLDPTLLTIAFVAMGALIGSRFVGVSTNAVRRAAGAGGVVTVIHVVFALVAALVGAAMLDLPVALMIVAFAPGGVEAMAAMAIALNLDPAFVAAHHVARLAILSVLLPWLGMRVMQ